MDCGGSGGGGHGWGTAGVRWDAVGEVGTWDCGSGVLAVEEKTEVKAFAGGVDVEIVGEVMSLLFHIYRIGRIHGAMGGVRGR